MKRRLALAALALVMAIGPGTLATSRSATATEQQASETVEGRVTKIDLERSLVTLRDGDGMEYEFEAPAETLKHLRVGDYIEAQRRPATN